MCWQAELRVTKVCKVGTGTTFGLTYPSGQIGGT
jgi:hypothetical protein